MKRILILSYCLLGAFCGRQVLVAAIRPDVSAGGIVPSAEVRPAAPATPVSPTTPTSPASPASRSAEAWLTVDQPVWNFGDVPRRGGNVSHDFVFRNEGSAPLVILRVVTSCSCVKASFPKRPVAPGGQGVIRITYEPHKSEPGTFNKVIRILSNSPTADTDILTVQGNSIDTPAGNGSAAGRGKMKTR